VRILELYCGIGALAAARPPGATVVGAVDQSLLALQVYRANFPHHPTLACNLETLGEDRLAAFRADLWWMSPPCQPFTGRGRRRDDGDPRAASFLVLVRALERLRPPLLALENVPGFAGSRTHRRLREALDRAGYQVAEHQVCPSEHGQPNRRRRFYLVASRGGPLRPLPPPRDPAHPLNSFLDHPEEPGLALDPVIREGYRRALHVVAADDPRAVTSCFTAAYGRSWVRSGSYLASDGGLALRRFSPREVLRLLGFPQEFRVPAGLSRSQAWRLAGNSLALPAVRAVLATLPELTTG
jgi:site-specific DNA-cytosine methylase